MICSIFYRTSLLMSSYCRRLMWLLAITPSGPQCGGTGLLDPPPWYSRGCHTDLISCLPSYDGQLLKINALVASHPISFINMYLLATHLECCKFLLNLRSF